MRAFLRVTQWWLVEGARIRAGRTRSRNRSPLPRTSCRILRIRLSCPAHVCRFMNVRQFSALDAAFRVDTLRPDRRIDRQRASRKMHALTVSIISFFLMTPIASGWLGVYLSPDAKEAVVAEVIPGTPAAKAGLVSGDVLIAVGSAKTPTRDTFVAEMKKMQPGARVKIMLRRGKRERMVVVRLGERPEDQGAGAGVGEPPEPRKSVRKPAPVRAAKPTSAPVAETEPGVQGAAASGTKGYLGIRVREGDGGLLVDRVLEGGPSAKSGLKQGDVLQVIGDQRIRSVEDLDGVLLKIVPGRKVAVGVARKGVTKSLMVEVGRRPEKGRDASGASADQAEVQPTGGGVAEEASPEAVPSEANPPRGPVRPAPRALPDVAPKLPQTPATRPAVTDKPLPVNKPGSATGGRASESNLQNELEGLRKELKELRRLLEQLRRGGR